MEPNDAVKNIVAAHGGEDFWNGLAVLEAEISASGLLFTFKRRPVLDHVRVTAYAREPRFVFLRDGFRFEVLDPVVVSSSSWRRLKACMPDDLPTHSREQVFYFDDNWQHQPG